jgi:hypothetical protein
MARLTDRITIKRDTEGENNQKRKKAKTIQRVTEQFFPKFQCKFRSQF